MSRFHIDSLDDKGGSLFLSKADSHHAVRVRRVKVGDVVEVFDGRGHKSLAVVALIKEGRVCVTLDKNSSQATASSVSDPSAVEITLAVSVIKPERMELLLQKACELGVAALVPLQSERCVIQLSPERWKAKMKRWEKICIESCKQCGRNKTPVIGPLESYDNFVKNHAKEFDTILIPTLSVAGRSLYDGIRNKKSNKPLVMIGPEGDFSKKEAELALSHGALPVSLGKLILRSETAGLYMLSALNFYYREIQEAKEKI